LKRTNHQEEKKKVDGSYKRRKNLKGHNLVAKPKVNYTRKREGARTRGGKGSMVTRDVKTSCRKNRSSVTFQCPGPRLMIEAKKRPLGVA